MLGALNISPLANYIITFIIIIIIVTLGYQIELHARLDLRARSILISSI